MHHPKIQPRGGTVKINFHDLHLQYASYKEEIDNAIHKVLNSAQFIMGEEVFNFENSLAEYLGNKHVIACASGTDALLLALMAIDIKPGDEVITTPFTFIATAEVIALLGATPVFADIQTDTYNIDPNKIADKITEKTRAILPVSLYGQPADMDEINTLAHDYSNRFGKKIYVIEDAAQSLGAEYKGRMSSNLSDLGCLSFFPTKPLGCYGDGGAITVKDDILADKIKSLRVHGQTKRYYHQYIGFNCRIDTIQAAVLQVKLKYLHEEVRKRHQIAKYYNALLSKQDVTLPFIKPDRTSVYAQYSIRHANRAQLIDFLKAKNIPTAIHYPQPVHLQECFSYLGLTRGSYPIAEKAANEILSLPMSAFITTGEQEYIAYAIQEALQTELVC
jgi:UDP-2-acetamido-2-deoxy-ribo-hexuluronate aminotransferase